MSILGLRIKKNNDNFHFWKSLHVAFPYGGFMQPSGFTWFLIVVDQAFLLFFFFGFVDWLVLFLS